MADSCQKIEIATVLRGYIGKKNWRHWFFVRQVNDVIDGGQSDTENTPENDVRNLHFSLGETAMPRTIFTVVHWKYVPSIHDLTFDDPGKLRILVNV